MDPALFYAGLRKRDSGLFGTSLSQGQVNGLERLLDTWDRYYSSDPIEFLAYDLATSYHETGATMQPIRENLNYSSEGIRNTFPKYFSGVQAAEYARQPQRIANRAYANRMGNGNEASGDGWRDRGESDVQNTGKSSLPLVQHTLKANQHKKPNRRPRRPMYMNATLKISLTPILLAVGLIQTGCQTTTRTGGTEPAKKATCSVFHLFEPGHTRNAIAGPPAQCC